MDLSSQMILFAKVVEQRSFSAAARAAGQTPSAVSRQIGSLEDRLGVRLLRRSKHGLALTEEGRAFYERCAEVASRIADAESFLASMSGTPKGVLRVATTVAFGKSQLMPLLPDFLERYPEVKISLEVTDRPIDLASENIDVGIRFSEAIDDSSLICRKLASNRRVIVAAPGYVARHGTPSTARDLAQHNCLRLTTVTGWNDWHLVDPDTKEPIMLAGNLEANSADALYHAALAGIGIARLSTYLVGQDIAAGRLLRLLPHYSDEGSDISIIYSERRNLAPKARVFIDYLTDRFGTVPPWERTPEAIRAAA